MKTITYEQYLKQEQRMTNLKKLGVEFIYTKSRIKLILGSVCLVIAIVPNGLGLIFYPLSFSLFASGGIDIYTIIRKNKQRVRVIINNLIGRWL